MSDIPPALPPSGSPPATAAAPQPPATQPPATQPGPGSSAAGQPATGQAASGQAAATPGQPPPVPAGTASPAQAPALPPELARAAAGTTVEGEVRSAGTDGAVTVRTAQGDVRLDLTRPQVAQLLKPGTPVTIEIRNPASQPPLVQLTVRAASGAAQGAATQPAVTTGSATPAPTVPLAVGRIVQATVVPGPAPAGQQPSANAAVTAATPQAVATGQPAAPPQGASAQGISAQASPAPTASASATSGPAAAGNVPAATQAAPPTTSAPTVPVPGGSASSTPSASPFPTGPAASNAPAPPAALAGRTPSPGAGTGAATSAPPPTPAATSTAASPAPTDAIRAAADQASANRHSQAPAATGQAATGSASAAEPAKANLPNGSVLTVRVAAVAEAAARPEGAARAVTGLVQQAGTGATPTRIDGQIAGLTAAGRPVVQSAVGYLALDARADLRLGTRIALDVLASRTAGPAERAAPLPVLAREWPALEAALKVLEEQLGPAAARQAIEAMPRPGPQLTATLLFFMTALRGGDVRGWLGRTATQALETAGRKGLLDSLSDDFKTLQRAADPSETGWRSFLIPVAWDDRRPIRLLTRKERRDGRDGRSGKPGTAFLVDLDLSNIGPFRLDGLVRSELVDLLIRTTTPLPVVMRRDIKALFDGTLERTGIIGRLAFKSSPVMPPLPVDLEASSTGATTTLSV